MAGQQPNAIKVDVPLVDTSFRSTMVIGTKMGVQLVVKWHIFDLLDIATMMAVPLVAAFTSLS
jgi:hypothetical protein